MIAGLKKREKKIGRGTRLRDQRSLRDSTILHGVCVGGHRVCVRRMEYVLDGFY